MQRVVKGIWIPIEIWESEDLKVMEKLFLVEIDSLDNEEGCFASNDYFSKFFNLSKNRCSEIIKSLESKKYLTISYKYRAGTKYIDKRILRVTGKFLDTRKIEYDTRKTDRDTRKTDRVYSEKCEDNNILINNIDIYKKEKETNFDKIIKQYTSNLDLREKIYDFIKVRKSLKKPLIDTSLKALLEKLDIVAKNDTERKEVLSKSILNSWTDIYELKENKATKNNKSFQPKITSQHFNAGNEAFRKYNPDELEALLKESQKDKWQ